MRRAEVMLGALTAALALVAVALTLTLPAVEYVNHAFPVGPSATFALPMAFSFFNLPVMASGPGALAVCLGAVIDARFVNRRSRIAPLVMVLAGALLSAVVLLLVWALHIALILSPSQPALPSSARSLPLAWVSPGSMRRA